MNIYGKTSHHLLKISSSHSPYIYILFLNRNLAWNKIAVIHPNAFSTLPSLRKLWVSHDLFMAYFKKLGPLNFLTNVGVAEETATHRLPSPQFSPGSSEVRPGRNPAPPRPRGPWLRIWRAGWQLFCLLKWNFPLSPSSQVGWNKMSFQSPRAFVLYLPS